MMPDMLIFEQHMLAAFLQFHADRPGSPFGGIRATHFFADEYVAHRASNDAGFTHLVSRAKEDAELLARLDRRVHRDHPTLYARVHAMTATH
jgi:hypothetical protein